MCLNNPICRVPGVLFVSVTSPDERSSFWGTRCSSRLTSGAEASFTLRIAVSSRPNIPRWENSARLVSRLRLLSRAFGSMGCANTVRGRPANARICHIARLVLDGAESTVVPALGGSQGKALLNFIGDLFRFGFGLAIL